MDNQELLELILIQTKSSTIILFFTAIILIGVFIDLSFTLYKKYIKKGDKK